MKARQAPFLLALLLSGLALAAPKRPVAWTNRDTWPHPIGNVSEFDFASRGEQLVFIEALATALSEERHKGVLGWLAWREPALVENFRRALLSCAAQKRLCPRTAPVTFRELVSWAKESLGALPADYRPWLAGARTFHATYVQELLRLAQLSSRTSSEILPVAEGEEFGESLPDRNFLLTFDDGPTGADGETNRVLRLMAGHDQHAVFFTVGAAVHARRSIKGLYDGQCLGSHGMAHESHVTSPATASALGAWNRELAGLQPKDARLRWFRPPYGQRTAAQVEELKREGIGVMLWNIDSQDWQAPPDASWVSGRVLTLMLLWRHGVILFHDVHPAARPALEQVFTVLEGGDAVTWADCRTLE